MRFFNRKVVNIVVTLAFRKLVWGLVLAITVLASVGGVTAYTQNQPTADTEVVYSTLLSSGAIETLLRLENGTVKSARRNANDCTVAFVNPLETLTHEVYNSNGGVTETTIEVILEPQEWRLELLDEYMKAQGCGVR